MHLQRSEPLWEVNPAPISPPPRGSIRPENQSRRGRRSYNRVGRRRLPAPTRAAEERRKKRCRHGAGIASSNVRRDRLPDALETTQPGQPADIHRSRNTVDHEADGPCIAAGELDLHFSDLLQVHQHRHHGVEHAVVGDEQVVDFNRQPVAAAYTVKPALTAGVIVGQPVDQRPAVADDLDDHAFTGDQLVEPVAAELRIDDQRGCYLGNRLGAVLDRLQVDAGGRLGIRRQRYQSTARLALVVAALGEPLVEDRRREDRRSGLAGDIRSAWREGRDRNPLARLIAEFAARHVDAGKEKEGRKAVNGLGYQILYVPDDLRLHADYLDLRVDHFVTLRQAEFIRHGRTC